jgi:hypothetical protein
LVNDPLINPFFGVGLMTYLQVVISSMEKGALIQNLEAIIIYQESSTNADGTRVILDVYPMMKGERRR